MHLPARSGLGILALTLAACTASGCSNQNTVGWMARVKICAADDVDSTSELMPARDANGSITRIVVSPSHTIADMGSLIFDTQGELLGHDTGGEFPWEDEALRAEEQARVDALMAGATIDGNAQPLSCW